jgi:hypothetical protein
VPATAAKTEIDALETSADIALFENFLDARET